mmetsp:Transcript_77375/g.250500  ORF Transcript_77375/g.250500 Transcript_77375/m.250500 type:complete len:317 (-) Transcript_77375:37-987(-)
MKITTAISGRPKIIDVTSVPTWRPPGFFLFRQQVAEGRTERSREHEPDPEQPHTADGRADCQDRSEQHELAVQACAASEAQLEIVGCEVTDRRAQSVGHDDASPIEELGKARHGSSDGEGAARAPPRDEEGQEDSEKQAHSFGVTDSIPCFLLGENVPVHHVGQASASETRRDDDEPIDGRHIPRGDQLHDQPHDEDTEEYSRCRLVPEVVGLRKHVREDLAECGREDLGEPIHEGQSRQLAWLLYLRLRLLLLWLLHLCTGVLSLGIHRRVAGHIERHGLRLVLGARHGALRRASKSSTPRTWSQHSLSLSFSLS